MNSVNLTVTKRTEAFFFFFSFLLSPFSWFILEKNNPSPLSPPPGSFDNMTAVRCPGAFQAATVPAISCPSPPGVNKKGLGAMEY